MTLTSTTFSFTYCIRITSAYIIKYVCMRVGEYAICTRFYLLYTAYCNSRPVKVSHGKFRYKSATSATSVFAAARRREWSVAICLSCRFVIRRKLATPLPIRRPSHTSIAAGNELLRASMHSNSGTILQQPEDRLDFLDSPSVAFLTAAAAAGKLKTTAAAVTAISPWWFRSFTAAPAWVATINQRPAISPSVYVTEKTE